MAIDHVIDLDCVPKRTLSTAGLVARLKARDRAAAVIKLYRDHGDQRPPAEMGFEMVRRTPDGAEETKTILIQDLLDDAAPLDPLAKYCVNCPANRAGTPFGCFSYISYPISRAAEVWLLKQLPGPEDALIFLLLRQTILEYTLQDEQVARMRSAPGIIFESTERFARRFEDVQITTDQVFEMLFLPGMITPAHATLLLLFFGGIPRDMDADTLLRMTQAGSADGAATDERNAPFLLETDPDDDESIRDIKAYFEALHYAYRLNVTLSLDA